MAGREKSEFSDGPATETPAGHFLFHYLRTAGALFVAHCNVIELVLLYNIPRNIGIPYSRSHRIRKSLVYTYIHDRSHPAAPPERRHSSPTTAAAAAAAASVTAVAARHHHHTYAAVAPASC